MPHLLALASALFCTASLAQSALSEADTISIQAAVVRAEISRYNIASDQEKPLRYCLDTTTQVDPPSALIAALSNEQVPVVAHSRCGEGCKIPEEFEGARFPCVFLTIGNAVSVGERMAIARGSFVAGPLFGRGGLYHLRKNGGAWEVVNYEMHWVS
jgi:hypothetical protein